MIWDRAKRGMVERTPRLDIRAIARDGWLTVGAKEISLGGDWFQLEWTDQPLGGKRPWFSCASCGGRCAIVFYGHSHYACRQCQNLGYASENETSYDRMLRRCIKLRGAMGQVSGGVAAPYPSKPHYRHWRTYWRERRKQQQLEQSMFEKLRTAFAKPLALNR